MSRMWRSVGVAGACGATPPLPAAATPVTASASATLKTETRRPTLRVWLRRRHVARGTGIRRTSYLRDGPVQNRWHSMKPLERTRVQLPAGLGEEFEVFVNGVVQQPGRDFRREGDELVFDRRLAREGRLGFWRWLSLFLGVAGTYRQNDSVDVIYDAGGRRVVASGLPLTAERD